MIIGSHAESLSARRAWIEIVNGLTSAVNSLAVALRKESVDRNHMQYCCKQGYFSVALRKESVDRNNENLPPLSSDSGGRSPQGERG